MFRFDGRVVVQRLVSQSLEDATQVLIRWHPSGWIPDEWHDAADYSLVTYRHVSTLPHDMVLQTLSKLV